ncbi:DUF6286 domain-containing protein [Streptomyces sp. bgisy022]|uniref:DUF6286 domain-containing protein n=1 Tax=Streptomyces sp. bgisy022 TaxID=3413769 RepID=UPI003D728EF9
MSGAPEQHATGPAPDAGTGTGTAPPAPGHPGPGAEPAPADRDLPGGHRRFWSTRRVPAALLALVLLVVAGAFLYDVAAVRAGRPASAWRRELARQLAERPLDDLWVRIGAGVAAALGLWLLLLALTPGLRALLPMRRTHPDVRAALHRDAAAMVLRDRAMEVAGVQAVRVRVRRRRADVRAVSHFRDLDDVRHDLDLVLAEAVRGLGLARPPALSLRVRRPGRKG